MIHNVVEPLFSLQNRVALITGAAGYLGREFSECLAGAGAKVVLYGRGKKIKAFTDQLRAQYGHEMVDCCQVDFCDENAFRAALLRTIQKHASIDILVNNAYEFSSETGFNDPSGRMEKISRTQWMRSLEAGVYWPALAIQIIGEKMKQQNRGSIINIGSMYALVSPHPNLYKGVNVFNPPSYSAAKSALLALTRYTAAFYGENNVRCNAIVAGAFPNTEPEAFNNPKDESFMERLREKTVLNRVGRPADLRGALILLSSDASSYITGQAIVVDGGWTIT
jgi:NAD(P)-dependent dehydrogenase (short-subunit alcohol dehydrogenase family)